MRYIWIDALCIIQDSQQDKDKELAKMATIYERATLTIIAASAAGANEGFLRPKTATRIDLRISYGPADTPGTMLIRTTDNINKAMYKFDDPTETRAWCFQESLLSRKCLIYSSFYLYWTCQEVGYADQDSTTSGDFVGSTRFWRRYVYNLPALLQTQEKNLELSESEYKSIWRLWQEVSTEYSRRQISFLSDRLPAISAVAQRIQDVTGDVYYAGLWRGDFYNALLWGKMPRDVLWTDGDLKIDYPVLPSRPEEYVAPSWSWLSCRGLIFYRIFNVCPKLKIENVEVELVNDEQLCGAVKDGSITLTARMGEISVLSQYRQGSYWLGRKKEEGHAEILDHPVAGQRKAWKAKGFADAKDAMTTGMERLWCLYGGLDVGSKAVGLILKQADDPKSQFRRVGSFVALYREVGWFEDAEVRTIRIV